MQCETNREGGETMLSVIHHAIGEGASDVHFGTESGFALRVQGEIRRLSDILADGSDFDHGLLEALKDPARSTTTLLTSLLAMISSDGGIAYNALNQGVVDSLVEAAGKANETGVLPYDIEESMSLPQEGNWRISLYRCDAQGLGMALRYLPEDIPSLNDLMPPVFTPVITHVKRLVERGQGLVLVTGTTGSGKSTTLAAMVDYINQTMTQKIITLEDPIEYRHVSKMSQIHHRQVGRDVPSFLKGLKSALRQDPDTILLGELRDVETISLALTAAETGHLVLGTLHSRDVESTITRIIEVFPPSQQPMVRSLLANSLQGVISQRLIKSERPEMRGGRVLLPEVAILSSGKGGVRATIQEGRYHQVRQNLEVMSNEGDGYYLSSDRARDQLKRENYL